MVFWAVLREKKVKQKEIKMSAFRQALTGTCGFPFGPGWLLKLQESCIAQSKSQAKWDVVPPFPAGAVLHSQNYCMPWSGEKAPLCAVRWKYPNRVERLGIEGGMLQLVFRCNREIIHPGAQQCSLSTASFPIDKPLLFCLLSPPSKSFSCSKYISLKKSTLRSSTKRTVKTHRTNRQDE